MPRKPLNYNSENPYHIFARSNNQEWFSLPSKQAWKVFCYFLNYVSQCYNFQVHAFVLMSNHYHLIGSTPDHNLPLVMNRFQTEVSVAVNEISQRSNHVFGGKYKACEIVSDNYIRNVFRYCYQNPLKIGASERVEQYALSTLSGEFGFSPLLINVNQKFNHACFGFDDPMDYLSYLNEEIDDVEKQTIKNSLMRTQLKDLKVRKNRRKI